MAVKRDGKWAIDITYIWTAEGWLYLAVVMDLYSTPVRALPNRDAGDLADSHFKQRFQHRR